MKYLFLIIILVYSFNSSAQTIEKDSVSGLYQTQGILEFENLKADLIFSKAKEWITLNYRSANDVIQLADKESLKIINKGNFKSDMFMKEGSIFHTLILEFKDGKLRYTYTDFSYYSKGSGELSFESKNLAFKKSLIKSTEKDIKESIEKLKKYIQNSNKKDDW
ncbi:hypothetical protein BB050_01480 [Flavobacterium anhuiense]|uniref:DUF4468 domain-containing protein n=1 Tax=Flavobacterium anhuiense TaxID=459526 RepID=A0AAC9D2X9_9FLAO|nr:DUF4468 domain-containing protein [Flavobacterium anhuiense]AOC94607.1 hypothetical protein BB050_01480 [Flavobacterium anhuiense]